MEITAIFGYDSMHFWLFRFRLCLVKPFFFAKLRARAPACCACPCCACSGRAPSCFARQSRQHRGGAPARALCWRCACLRCRACVSHARVACTRCVCACCACLCFLRACVSHARVVCTCCACPCYACPRCARSCGVWCACAAFAYIVRRSLTKGTVARWRGRQHWDKTSKYSSTRHVGKQEQSYGTENG